MKSQQVFIALQLDSAIGKFTQYIQLNRNYKKCCVKSISLKDSAASVTNEICQFNSSLFDGVFAVIPNFENAMNVIEAEYQSNNLTGYQSSTYDFYLNDISGDPYDFSGDYIDLVIHLHFYDNKRS
jgi:hypothetical protein